MTGSSSNRNPNGWTWVFGKNNKQNSKPIDNPFVKDIEKIATSFFVTNFPESLEEKNLWKEFQPYGRIVDAFIANKRSKIEAEDIMSMGRVCIATTMSSCIFETVSMIIHAPRESVGPNHHTHTPPVRPNVSYRGPSTFPSKHSYAYVANGNVAPKGDSNNGAQGSNALKKVTSMFGKFKFFDIEAEDIMSMGRVCIATTMSSCIFETVSMIIHGKTFDVHMKEVSTWSTRLANDSNSIDFEFSEEESRTSNEDECPNNASMISFNRPIRRNEDFDESKDHWLTLKNTPYPHQRYVVYNTLVNEEEPTSLTSIRPIVFNDTLTSEAALSCEPKVSSLNNDETNFRISFDESDDEDCTHSLYSVFVKRIHRIQHKYQYGISWGMDPAYRLPVQFL
nr:RNA-directed DNA polymerase, eukaryota, reverse transcriptase zinc-binding domain protein [Tanacetum cinerariifolium]